MVDDILLQNDSSDDDIWDSSDPEAIGPAAALFDPLDNAFEQHWSWAQMDRTLVDEMEIESWRRCEEGADAIISAQAVDEVASGQQPFERALDDLSAIKNRVLSK